MKKCIGLRVMISVVAKFSAVCGRSRRKLRLFQAYTIRASTIAMHCCLPVRLIRTTRL